MLSGLCIQGCCCTNTVSVLVKGCSGAIASASVTVTDGGADTLGTCTTASDGTCVINVGNYTGSISVTVAIPTGPSQTQTSSIPNDGECHAISLEFDFLDKICTTVTGCDGALDGVTIAISGAVSASGSTSGGSWCYIPTTNATGSLTVSATYNGRTQTQTVTINVPTSVGCAFAFGFVTRVCCCVANGCDNAPFSAVSPSVSLTVNGTSAGTGTPDSNGRVCINPTYGCVPGDTIVFTASATGFTTGTLTVTLPSGLSGCGGPDSGDPACLNQWTSENGLSPCASGTGCATDTSFGTITLVVASPDCCNPDSATGCADYPIPSTLTVNDGFGDVTLTNDGSCVYLGCATRTASGTSNNPSCVPVSGSGSVPVFFKFSGSTLTISVCACTGLDYPRTDVPCTETDPSPGWYPGCTTSGGIDFVSCTLTWSACDPIDGSCTIPGASLSLSLSTIYGSGISATLTA